MGMVEVKTSELVGAALDWAVAQAIGDTNRIESRFVDEPEGCAKIIYWCSTSYSTNWEQGGPLFDEFATCMDYYDGWLVAVQGGDAHGYTKLEAFCRALVSAKLGDVVQIPAELVSTK